MHISEYQRAADSTDVSSRAPWVGLNQNLFGLVEKVGCMAFAMKSRMRDKGSYSVSSFREDVETAIGEALWYLAAVATHFQLDLEAIAEKNLKNNRQRWGSHRDEQGQLFHGRHSDLFPDAEKFPQMMTAEFTNVQRPNRVSWLSVTGVKVDGVTFGDPVDDNSRTEDGYRYHDVLHLAFAAHLDWSPVVRKLMQNKRKSDPATDKFDDGARARDTEEAVSNLIHHNARANNYFLHAKRLDTKLLADVQGLVIDLEVRDRTAHEWEQAILAAYEVFNELRTNDGGFVDVYFQSPPKLVFRKSRSS
jgi:NTP pyrophosphatase (non-canonical NTP hydrolase)